MSVIKDEVQAGWSEQRQVFDREIKHVTPYHIQVAHLLVHIATRTRDDADALRTCCELVQDDFSIILDLDIFDAIKDITEDGDTPRIVEVFQDEITQLSLVPKPLHVNSLYSQHLGF